MNGNFEAATLERRAYQREWRAKNRARVRRYNAEYWERRAMRREQEATEDAAHENNSRSRKANQGV